MLELAGAVMLGKWGYYADFVLAPLLLLLACGGRIVSVGIVVGYLLWTLIEYVLHRFILHRYFHDQHWQHHLHPTANSGIASWWTTVVFVAFYALLLHAIGDPLASSLFIGLMAGYISYIVSHHAIHRWWLPLWLHPLRERHGVHHGGQEVNFNVLFPLWDHVFGTYVPHWRTMND